MEEEELANALAMIKALPIVTDAKQIGSSKDGVIARISCPASCKHRRFSEQRQLSAKNDTLLKCATSLLELLRTKHGSCMRA